MPAKYFAFDTETTGTDHAVDEILSYAFVVLDEQLVEISRQQRFFFPSAEERVHPKAAEVNGYTRAKWAEKGALDQSTLAMMLTQDWADHGVARLMPIGHNVSFDLNFFKKHADAKAMYKALSYHFVDTMVLAIAMDQAKGITGSYSLGPLCARYGVELKGAHDSLADIVATIELYKIFVGILRGGQELPAAAPKTFLTKTAESYVFASGKHKDADINDTRVPPGYITWALGTVTLTDDERRALGARVGIFS